jgi:hypothetical protein
MNDKIAKITAEALDRAVPETYTTLDQDQLTRFADEFARRIIRECAYVNHKSDYSDGEFHAQELCEHFGVEL